MIEIAAKLTEEMDKVLERIMSILPLYHSTFQSEPEQVRRH